MDAFAVCSSARISRLLLWTPKIAFSFSFFRHSTRGFPIAALFPAGPRRAQRDGSKLPLALRRQSSFRWGVLLISLQTTISTYYVLGRRHSKFDSSIKDALTPSLSESVDLSDYPVFGQSRSSQLGNLAFS